MIDCSERTAALPAILLTLSGSALLRVASAWPRASFWIQSEALLHSLLTQSSLIYEALSMPVLWSHGDVYLFSAKVLTFNTRTFMIKSQFSF